MRATTFIGLLALVLAGCTATIDDPSGGDDGSGSGSGTGGTGAGSGSGGGSGGGGGGHGSGSGMGGGDQPDDGGGTGQPADGCPAGDLGVIEAADGAEAYEEPVDATDPESPAVRYLIGSLPDEGSFEVYLYDGYGAFTEGSAAAGSYPIAGDDADPALCGVCVYLYLTSEGVEHSFLATAGSIELSSVEDRLEGTGDALALSELEDQTALKADGCEASISAVKFGADMETLTP